MHNRILRITSVVLATIVILSSIVLIYKRGQIFGVSVTGVQPAVAKYYYPTSQSTAADYSCEVDSKGALTVIVGGKKYTITSSFSYPATNGWNNFGAQTMPESGWKVVVGRSSQTVTTVSAEGAHYRVLRSISRVGTKLVIADHFYNKTDQQIGVIVDHTYKYSDSEEPSIYLAGKNDVDFSYFSSYGNPTVFIGNDATGIGLVARNDKFRVQGVGRKDAVVRTATFSDEYFGLEARADTTLTWAVYPQSSSDYFDFANVLRNDEGGNFTINNAVWFDKNGTYNGWKQMSTAQLKQFLTQLNVKYVVIQSPNRIPHAGTSTNEVAVGTALLDEVDPGASGWAYVDKAVAAIRATGLDLKILMYFNMYLDNSKDVLSKYPDSLEHDHTTGDPLVWSTAHPDTYVMLPVGATPATRNTYAKRLQEALALPSAHHFDGFFLDTYRFAKDAFSYDTALQAPQTDNDFTFFTSRSTHLITRNITSAILKTQSFKTAFMHSVVDGGGSLITNGAPITLDENSIVAPHFTETIQYGYQRSTDLTSPIGLASPGTYAGAIQTPVVSAEDDIRNLREHLDIGKLHFPYQYSPHWNNNPYQAIYPINPIETHPGYIFSADKIITDKPGYFGFGGVNLMEATIYDASGHFVSKIGGNISHDGKTFVNLMGLKPGYLAVILKKDIGNTHVPLPN